MIVILSSFKAHIEKPGVRLPLRRITNSGPSKTRKRTYSNSVESFDNVEEVTTESLDYSKKILHAVWHPKQNIIALAATNRLYIFEDK